MRFGKGIHLTAWVHGLAMVEDSIVGERTRIWQFATVIKGTVLGADCNVGASATLSGAHFGDGCKISSGVVMGPGFKVGNRVFVGPNVVMANDVYPSVDPAGYDDEALRSGEQWAVIVGDDCMIGANSVILPGMTIGHGAVIAAGAVVNRVVPPECIWHHDGQLSPVPHNWRERRMRFAANPEEV